MVVLCSTLVSDYDLRLEGYPAHLVMSRKPHNLERPVAAIRSLRQPSVSFGVPHYDQGFLNRSSQADGSTIDTMSHGASSSKHNRTEGEAAEGGSVYSYNSTRDIERFVRELHGRRFNTLNESYLLPSDNAEWNRLDKQNSAYLIGMGGLYPCPDEVEAILAPDPTSTEPKQILDLGCGTGQWAIEMANLFPHCDVKGVDLAPTPLDPELFPPNVSFEIDDVNQGLDHFHNGFDLVHVRCIMTGITNPDEAIREFTRCLKPGGILILIDGDKDFLDENFRKVPLAKIPGDEDVSAVSDGEDGSMFLRMVWEAHEASKMAGSALERGIELIDHGLWDQPLMDPTTAVVGSVYLPCGPWPRSTDLEQTQALQYAGILMRQVFLNIHRAYHAIMLKHGLDQATLDAWSQRADEELRLPKPKMWTRLRMCWARRKSADGSPAPPLHINHPYSLNPIPPLNQASISQPQPSSYQPSGFTPLMPPLRKHPYPPPTLIFSREEAVAARAARLAMNGEWPTSAIWRASQATSQTVVPDHTQNQHQRVESGSDRD